VVATTVLLNGQEGATYAGDTVLLQAGTGTGTITFAAEDPAVTCTDTLASLGLAIDASGHVTGTVTAVAGTYSVGIQVTDGLGCTTTACVDITIDTPCCAILCGDATNEGFVNIIDALYIAQADAGLIDPMASPDGPTRICNGDVNQDGRLSIIDSLWVAQYVVGLRTLSCC
jgi:hypothetical protein